MSGSNINANINVDAAQFQAAMAAAAASTQQFAQQAQAAFQQASASMAQSSAAMAAAAAQAAAAAATLQNRITQVGTSAGYTARKLSAMLDEAIAGRWRQFDGTLASVVTTFGRLNIAMTAAAAGVAGLAIGVGYLAVQWIKAENAAKEAAGAMTIAGQNTGASIDGLSKEIASNAAHWHEWQSTSGDVTKTMAGLSGDAAQFRQQLTQLAYSQAALTQGDVAKYAQDLFEAFNKGGSGAVGFADKIHLLDPALRSQVEAMVGAKQESQAMGVIIDQLNKRYGASGEAVNKLNIGIAEKMRLSVMAADGDMDAAAKLNEWDEAHKKAYEEATTNQIPPIAPQARDDAAAVAQLDMATQKRTQATLELAAAQRAQKAAQDSGDVAAQQSAINAIIEAQKKISETHTASEEQQHQATLRSLDEQIAAEHDHANRVAALKQQVAAEDAKYYGDSSNQARTSATQATAAQREAADAQLRLNLAKLDGQINQEKNSLGATLAIYDQKLALLRAADKADTLEYQEVLNQKANAARGAGNQDVRSEEEALRAKQELYGKDYAAKLAIEDQILSIVKAHYGAQSTQYQTEMIRRSRLMEEEKEQAASVEQQKIASASRTNQIMYNDLKKNLDQEVAQYQITKKEELAQLDAFQQSHDQKLVAMLDAEIKSLTQGTVAWQEATNKREELLQRMKEQHDAIADEIAQADRKAAEKSTQEWEQAFDKISEASESAISGMISGQDSFQKAALKVGQAVVQDAVKTGLQMLGSWVATELAKTASTTTQNAVREAQDKSGQTGLVTLLLRSLGIHTATETEKTAATTTGTGAREGIQTAADSKDNLSFIARAAKWVASELGMTSATATGTTTRVGVQTGADTEAAGTAVTSNVTQALSYAAVGGAAAGASTAAIPVVGPEMAPEAAATVYGDLASYAGMASMATGTMNVPKDMLANIHAGEMVVPRTFADGIRSQMSGGGRGGDTTHMNSSINYSPSFHGGSSDIKAVARNNFKEFKSYMNNVTRNGNLMVPGR
jgi:hypothetical protein